jgi:hypothetical protein
MYEAGHMLTLVEAQSQRHSKSKLVNQATAELNLRPCSGVVTRCHRVEVIGYERIILPPFLNFPPCIRSSC